MPSSIASRAALLLLPLLGACGGGDPPADPASQPLAVVLGPEDVARARLSDFAPGVTLTGTLEPAERVEIRAQVAGIVSDLAVERGDAVRRGQVLARIRAEGIRGQASGARSGVASARTALALAERQLASARTLYEAGAASELDFRGAQAQVETARAQVAAAQGQAAVAGEQVDQTVLAAPLSGRVSDRVANPGEAVSPGDPLLTLVDAATLELRGQVPLDRAAEVRAGQGVAFAVDAFPGRQFRGTVWRVDPVADTATRQVGVTLRLPNEGGALIAGAFATGRVVTETTRQAVVVPAAAVRGSGASAYVLVVDGGKVARRPVTVGETDEARRETAVAAGLRGGETVVTARGEIAAGTPVRIAPTEGAR